MLTDNIDLARVEAQERRARRLHVYLTSELYLQQTECREALGRIETQIATAKHEVEQRGRVIRPDDYGPVIMRMERDRDAKRAELQRINAEIQQVAPRWETAQRLARKLRKHAEKRGVVGATQTDSSIGDRDDFGPARADMASLNRALGVA